MTIRIYKLAKQLKFDPHELCQLCELAGITGKGSALASLDNAEVHQLKAYLPRRMPCTMIAPAAVAATQSNVATNPLAQSDSIPLPSRASEEEPELVLVGLPLFLRVCCIVTVFSGAVFLWRGLVSPFLGLFYEWAEPLRKVANQMGSFPHFLFWAAFIGFTIHILNRWCAFSRAIRGVLELFSLENSRQLRTIRTKDVLSQAQQWLIAGWAIVLCCAAWTTGMFFYPMQGDGLKWFVVARLLEGISFCNALLILLFALDKSRSRLSEHKTKIRRVPEARLHIGEFFLGCPASLVSQNLFRHKSTKAEYQQVFRSLALWNVVLGGALVSAIVGWQRYELLLAILFCGLAGLTIYLASAKHAKAKKKIEQAIHTDRCSVHALEASVSGGQASHWPGAKMYESWMQLDPDEIDRAGLRARVNAWLPINWALMTALGFATCMSWWMVGTWIGFDEAFPDPWRWPLYIVRLHLPVNRDLEDMTLFTGYVLMAIWVLCYYRPTRVSLIYLPIHLLKRGACSIQWISLKCANDFSGPTLLAYFFAWVLTVTGCVIAGQRLSTGELPSLLLFGSPPLLPVVWAMTLTSLFAELLLATDENGLVFKSDYRLRLRRDVLKGIVISVASGFGGVLGAWVGLFIAPQFPLIRPWRRESMSRSLPPFSMDEAYFLFRCTFILVFVVPMGCFINGPSFSILGMMAGFFVTVISLTWAWNALLRHYGLKGPGLWDSLD